MLDNLRFHQKFIAIPPLPPVPLAAVAAGRVRSTSR
jgi:hypothetical protein